MICILLFFAMMPDSVADLLRTELQSRVTSVKLHIGAFVLLKGNTSSPPPLLLAALVALLRTLASLGALWYSCRTPRYALENETKGSKFSEGNGLAALLRGPDPL